MSLSQQLAPVGERPQASGLSTMPDAPRFWSDGSVIETLPRGWRVVRARPMRAGLTLHDIEDEAGTVRTWFTSGDGMLMGHRPDRLPDAAIATVRRCVLAEGALDLCGPDGSVLRLDRGYMSDIVLDPLTTGANGVMMRDPLGRIRLIHHADGTPLTHLNPGWSVRLLFTGFAPLLVLDLHHVHGMRAVWFLDETGLFLGGDLHGLGDAMRRGIVAYGHARSLQHPDHMQHDLAGYCLLNSVIRAQIDPLLGAGPGAPRRVRAPRGDGSPDVAMAPASGPVAVVESLALQRDGCIDRRAADGWFSLDDRCLANADGASLSFALPYRPRFLRLSLTLNAIGRARRATVHLDGWELASFPIDHNLLQPERRDVWAPAECLRDLSARFEITFDPPDRGIGCCLEAASLAIGPRVADVEIPAIRDLMGRFGSLGFDCEFGFVQRVFGAEPLGLLRFAGYGFRSNLVRLIETDFDGLGSPGSLGALVRREQFRRPDGQVDEWEEFYMTDLVRHFRFHTWSGPAESSEAEALAANEQKLAYLARKMVEDFEDGEKIWVYKDAKPVADHAEVFALFGAINRKAPNKLFWVTRMVDGRPPGAVEWVAPGLLRGYSDQPHEDAKIFDPQMWQTLCVNAYRAFAERADSRT